MTKRCKNCEHCFRRKGLSTSYYLCMLKPMKDKPEKEKWFEKVKENNCCEKHRFKKGIVQ